MKLAFRRSFLYNGPCPECGTQCEITVSLLVSVTFLDVAAEVEGVVVDEGCDHVRILSHGSITRSDLDDFLVVAEPVEEPVEAL